MPWGCSSSCPPWLAQLRRELHKDALPSTGSEMVCQGVYVLMESRSTGETGTLRIVPSDSARRGYFATYGRVVALRPQSETAGLSGLFDPANDVSTP